MFTINPSSLSLTYQKQGEIVTQVNLARFRHIGLRRGTDPEGIRLLSEAIPTLGEGEYEGSSIGHRTILGAK
jgi:hypothetical protein